MRCLNCGYPNPDGAMVCAKCGKPFVVNTPNPQPAFTQAVQPYEPQPRPTVVCPGGQMPQPLRQTVVNVQGQNFSCPACGYPVVGNSGTCPNCGTPILPAQPVQQVPLAQPVQQVPVSPQASVPASVAPQPSAPQHAAFDPNMTITCDKCGCEMSLNNKFCPNCGERVHLATIGPNAFRKKSGPKCSLTIIPEEGEGIEATKNEYEGNSIILNRNNTETTNRTITSREQAELICKDGKWYILNKSEYGSTYIVAKRELELQPGDIVVLGDRCFKFDAEEK